MTEAPEEQGILIPEKVPEKKTLKTRTPAQLEVLARARQKANEIRKVNMEIKNKEKEIKTIEKIKNANEIQQRHSELVSSIVPTETKPIEIPIVKQKKPVVDSDSSDDEMVVIKIPKKKIAKYHKLVNKIPEVVNPIIKPKNPLFYI